MDIPTLKNCLYCSNVIPFNSRLASRYSESKYCSHNCFLEYLKKNGNKNTTTHGLSKTAIYRCWKGLQSRCDKTNNIMYSRYGGRGITYDKRWVKFSEFFKDMGDTYEEGLSLDRIDNDGNYCKENCRWVTMKTQQNNKSTNRVITFRGESKNLSQWADSIGLKTITLFYRLKSGMSLEEALTRPKQINKGVTVDKKGLYRVRVNIKGKPRIIGRYKTEEEAIKVYKEVKNLSLGLNDQPEDTKQFILSILNK